MAQSLNDSISSILPTPSPVSPRATPSTKSHRHRAPRAPTTPPHLGRTPQTLPAFPPASQPPPRPAPTRALPPERLSSYRQYAEPPCGASPRLLDPAPASRPRPPRAASPASNSARPPSLP